MVQGSDIGEGLTMAQETAEVVDYSSYSFWGMVTIKVEPAIRGIVGVIVRVKSI